MYDPKDFTIRQTSPMDFTPYVFPMRGELLIKHPYQLPLPSSVGNKQQADTVMATMLEYLRQQEKWLEDLRQYEDGKTLTRFAIAACKNLGFTPRSDKQAEGIFTLGAQAARVLVHTCDAAKLNQIYEGMRAIVEGLDLKDVPIEPAKAPKARAHK
ncbi:MAG TPA: hypothetical protein PKN48_01010 [Bacteroidales bacterium]|nr:hypothetical protein [Bacteroidales bacterium]